MLLENLPAPSQPMIGQGFFTNAHDLVFNQPVMLNMSSAKDKGAEAAEICVAWSNAVAVLRWLAPFTMSGAEFDSSIRDPPPCCHPGTRIAILDTIRRWVDDLERVCHLFWLNGPAGVGKSAIAQTLAEELSSTSKLGASLFFSRPNNCHTPTLVFPTIAYQLAVKFPPYREYLGQKMVDDPKLFEKSIEHQFKILIVEPFVNLKLATGVGKWVILMDGLDECEGEDKQALIVRLIARFSRRYPAAPFIWFISSRPEVHLNLVFESRDITGGKLLVHEVPADSEQACRDVEKFLRAKFEEIRHKYRDVIPVHSRWPTESDITRICNACSGLFVLASTLALFLDDPDIGDPVSQLAIVLALPGNNIQVDPLATLHAFYTRILDAVPKSMLPTLKLLLAFTLASSSPLVYSDDGLPLVITATLFCLQQNAVYAALRKLHSVVRVPPLEKSGLQGITFYHASFADFLCDASKSGDYAIDANHFYTKWWWCNFAMVQKGYSSSEFVQLYYLAKGL